MQSSDLIGQRSERLAHAEALKKAGILLYPATSQKTASNAVIKQHFEEYNKKEIYITGKIRSIREHGKLQFWTIEDASGALQLMIRKGELQSQEGYLSWELLSYIDTGDYIEAYGVIDKTSRGEISLFVKNLRLLGKALRPLPTEFDNKEDRYRKRYIDMQVNPATRELFRKKALFWRSMRQELEKEGFTEVFLPVLEHTTGGADAKPFITHYDELDEELFMRISLELYSKRAIGGGFDKVYAMGPVFRNEGMSDEHANEYIMTEWYQAYADYRDNMKLTQRIYRNVAQEVFGTTKFTTHDHTFDLADEWKEIDYAGIIQERFGINIFNASEEDMLKVINEQGIHIVGANRIRIIDNLWKAIRKTIAGPAFLVNQPTFISPLAKTHDDNPAITQRFQIILAGSEIGNGYSEINDPLEQLARFREQERMRKAGDDEAQMLDLDFVEMLEYGMPPTSGFGVSERLFWFLANVTAREGTMFPQLRQEKDNMNAKIYGSTEPQSSGATTTTNSSEKSKKHYIIFDVDGVLVDSSEATLNTAIANNLASDREQALTRRIAFHKDLKTHEEEAISEEKFQEKVKSVQDWCTAMLKDSPQPFHDFIAELKKISPVEFAVVSNGSKAYLSEVLKDIGITFTHVLSYEDAPSKTDRIRNILNDWQVAPEDVYFVTDTVRDVLEAERILPVQNILGAAWGWHGKDVLLEALPERQILNEFSDIHKLINNIELRSAAEAVSQYHNVPKYLIFDFDGVLGDTFESTVQTGLEFGWGTTREEVIASMMHHATTKPSYIDKKDQEFLALRNKQITDFSQALRDKGIKLFDGFMYELEKIQNAKFAIVTAGSVIYVNKDLFKKYSVTFDPILTEEDHHTKVEKVLKVCEQWGIQPKQAYYITDTLTDYFDLIQVLKPYHIFGTAWGFVGTQRLRAAMPQSQILQQFSDIHHIFSATLGLMPAPLNPELSITRDKALTIVKEHIPNKNLVSHCLAVEAFMKALAKRLGGNETLWGMAGLLHDADWEETRHSPREHTLRTVEWINEAGEVSPELTQAIYAHAHHVTGKPAPVTLMDWALFCGDELTGLIVAVTLMQPSKKLADTSVESIMKKFNSKGFAAGVDREQVKLCEDKLGIPLIEFITICRDAMLDIAPELGL